MTLLFAGLWGAAAGSGLLLGALAGYFLRLPQRLIAGALAFGAGVLISALAFELLDEAFQRAGVLHVAAGFMAGAVFFTLANRLLSAVGARQRGRDTRRAAAAEESQGAALAVGALMDGIPESIVIGLGMLEGGTVSIVTVIAVFLSNLPEGLSGASSMRSAGHSAGRIFAIWGGLVCVTGIAAIAGYGLFSHLSPIWLAIASAVGAGAILAMLVDTMIPEAFAEDHDYAGVITAFGFVLSFVLSKSFG
ncbi:ZIP family metal transporter [Afifella sp. IM 167]|uniref:ZIP family metal transporter n=1 Tax=Afifella sp. IM 167 TaxID=2033586 RepID=UPI001CCC3104|nr:ZIP family zinc transporter [Afifella sp. IM 167]MBZ8135331.1 ZIP family zinc transporter [Afifella sp. IM 167]